jgi:protein-disulfide isomerase
MRVLDQTWGYLLSEDLKSGYKSAWFWAMAVVAGVVLAGSYFFFHRAVGHLTGTAVEIVGEDARSLGPANARTTIVIYSDFQCPWCKIASEVLQQLSTEMSGDIRVTYKFYPLDHNCNPSVRRPMHLYACSAAVAAYCASTQDKFWIYHDYVFTSQDELPDVRLLEFARASQLDLMKFDACVRDNRSREEVQKNIAEGIRLGVQVTPSIFINGQLYSGPITLSAIRDTIAASK